MQLLIFKGRVGMKVGTNYDDDKKYNDSFLTLPLLNIILTQTQLILQEIFKNFLIFSPSILTPQTKSVAKFFQFFLFSPLTFRPSFLA